MDQILEFEEIAREELSDGETVEEEGEDVPPEGEATRAERKSFIVKKPAFLQSYLSIMSYMNILEDQCKIGGKGIFDEPIEQYVEVPPKVNQLLGRFFVITSRFLRLLRRRIKIRIN
jgi:hypothetical protein